MMSMARPANVETQHLSDAERAALDNAAGSARLEGIEIPEDHQALAAAYLAGEVDEDTYRARARALTGKDLGIDI
jgi:hypothetical protein